MAGLERFTNVHHEETSKHIESEMYQGEYVHCGENCRLGGRSYQGIRTNLLHLSSGINRPTAVSS